VIISQFAGGTFVQTKDFLEKLTFVLKLKKFI